jgi:phosphohistidine phosphatase SixA
MRGLARLVVVGVGVVSAVLVGIGPSHAIADRWAELDGQRGVVVLMRHALAPGGGDPTGFRLGDCRTQRNLSSDGRAQARRIGESIRDSGIEVAGVLASPWCRSAQTAWLLDVGQVRTRSFLGSTFTAAQSVADRREARTRRLIASHRGEDGVLILVGHYANILDLTGLTSDSGEAIAVRMGEGGDLDVLRRIPAS